MKPIPFEAMTPGQRERAKVIGIPVAEPLHRSAEEWRAAADESLEKARLAMAEAAIADSYEEAERLLREAGRQLHIADGQLKRASGSAR